MDVQAQADGQRNGWSRPVALPDDMDSVDRVPETGLVDLPLHVFWSGPGRMWDLDDKRQKAQVYELVLTEGTEEDVRRLSTLMSWCDCGQTFGCPPMYVKRGLLICEACEVSNSRANRIPESNSYDRVEGCGG